MPLAEGWSHPRGGRHSQRRTATWPDPPKPRQGGRHTPRRGDRDRAVHHRADDLLLAAARGKQNATRWTVAMALGLRQGEVLGLGWDDLNLATGINETTTGRSPRSGNETAGQRVPPAGLEPATRRLEGGRSIQLSYGSLKRCSDQGFVDQSGSLEPFGGMAADSHGPRGPMTETATPMSVGDLRTRIPTSSGPSGRPKSQNPRAGVQPQLRGSSSPPVTRSATRCKRSRRTLASSSLSPIRS
jgi:hypothetical protein